MILRFTLNIARVEYFFFFCQNRLVTLVKLKLEVVSSAHRIPTLQECCVDSDYRRNLLVIVLGGIELLAYFTYQDSLLHGVLEYTVTRRTSV